MQEVISSYGYAGPPGGMAADSTFGDPYSNGSGSARISKRRRMNDEQPTWDPIDAQSSHGAEQTAASYDTAAIGLAAQEGAGHSALGDSSQPPAVALWSSSPYPDVASYTQPYFYEQTDPSIYTSPWPPTDGNAAYNNTSNFNNHVLPAGNMPFFPANAAAEPNDAFDATGNGRAYQDFQQPDANLEYVYADTQTRDEVPQSGSALYLEDASMHLKLQSLSILDNLATQLIHTIAKASYPQIQDLMRGNETEEGQAYTTLKNLFDQTRKVYSQETPFIDAITIQTFQPNQQEVIRKANIATFVSSILGAHDVSFFHLNEYFMETFVPSGHRLLKWQGAIYLELKTQTYISALMNSDGSPEAMLDELFPPDLDALILTRHPDAPSLSPSEQDFIDRCKARKQYLMAEPSTEEAIQELPKKYQWSDFVREFASCINKNVDGIMNVPARTALGAAAGDKRTASAVETLGGGRNSLAASGAANGLPGVPSLTHQGSSSGEKKSGAPSSTVRQPWNKSEEDALLAGLEKVNGPHWSQILALYGRGGSVSEVLKDRNQVQLKDKARNLKLWYLKMGKEVPVALRGVTGELRKRGGARARAALGMLEDDPDAQGGADDAEGENIDPDLGSHQRSSKKKKGRK